jgi:sulfonate transport system permease protein
MVAFQPGGPPTAETSPVPRSRGRRGRPSAWEDRAARDPAGVRLRWELAALLVGAGIWEAVGKGYPLQVAPPSQVWSAGVKLARSGELGGQIAVTLRDLFIGFAFAMLAGVLLALLMGLSRLVAHIADMYLYWLLSVPEIALIPFIVVLLGYSAVARFVVILVFALPVITQQVMEGVRAIPENLLDMSTSFEVTGWRRLTRVIVPAALPSIMVATRLGFARSILGVVSAGIFMQLFGLGGRIYFYQQQFEVADMLLYLLVVVALGVIGTRVIQWLDRRVTHWTSSAAA